ncbi:hypothetical protein BLNAU_2315 [Blattamonas nauphoetae]|uniref:Uncharacterized protein n=1 Tax=Blattamonas nauphoetae TaxID=2049346 RepID=A0ABQ9YGL4_9EUKA|nr:hypothetical protein BLNAU_2315 [Blattamonas nauphoetae]
MSGEGWMIALIRINQIVAQEVESQGKCKDYEIFITTLVSEGLNDTIEMRLKGRGEDIRASSHKTRSENRKYGRLKSRKSTAWVGEGDGLQTANGVEIGKLISGDVTSKIFLDRSNEGSFDDDGDCVYGDELWSAGAADCGWKFECSELLVSVCGSDVGLLIVLLSLFVIGIELVRSLMFLIQTKGGTIALCDFLGSFTVLVGTVLLFLAYMFDMNEFVKQKSKIDIPLLGDDCEHLEPASFEA